MNTAEMKTKVVDTVSKTSKDVLMAGLGVVATIEEQGKKTFEMLVEKGKAYEPTIEKMGVVKSFEDAKGRMESIGKRVEEGVTGTTEAVLHRFGMPSHNEIQALIARVEALTAKVEAMGKAK
jgi:poly(hydroxyalkanoate) granule-associated protein